MHPCSLITEHALAPLESVARSRGFVLTGYLHCVHVMHIPQIVETQPLVGNLEDLTNLLNEFAGDDIYQAKVKVWIHAAYSSSQ